MGLCQSCLCEEDGLEQQLTDNILEKPKEPQPRKLIENIIQLGELRRNKVKETRQACQLIIEGDELVNVIHTNEKHTTNQDINKVIIRLRFPIKLSLRLPLWRARAIKSFHKIN